MHPCGKAVGVPADNVLSRPELSVVSIRFFRDVVHGVGRDFSGGTVVVP